MRFKKSKKTNHKKEKFPIMKYHNKIMKVMMQRQNWLKKEKEKEEKG
jgi:hypothetical protein